MKILFISSICNEELFDNLINNDDEIKPSIAGQNFDKMIAEGINKRENIELLSIIPSASYPKSNNLFMYNKNTFLKNDIKLNYIPFINITFIKQIMIFVYSLFFLIYWNYNNKEIKNRKILLNLSYLPTAIPALLIGKVTDVPVAVLMPDVTSYRFNYSTINNKIKVILIKLYKFISKFIDDMFDGYILLTEQMNDLVNDRNKPHIIIEGLWKDVFNDIKSKIHKKNKVIMYAGNIREKYGISKLIEAFILMDRNDVELWVFGDGDFKNSLYNLSNKYSNIKYFGLVPHNDIVQYELKASLLINPRPSNEEFTKYSFPSKTIEYMASGTPLLTTRLPGIPDEYFEYVYTFDNENIKDMAKKIEKLLDKDSTELQKKGYKARKFILKNKNYKVQTYKIINFLKSI